MPSHSQKAPTRNTSKFSMPTPIYRVFSSFLQKQNSKNPHNKNSLFSSSIVFFITEMGLKVRTLIPTTISIIFIFFFSSFQPLTAARPLDLEWGSKRQITVLQSLQKGPVAPSGRSGCTYVSRNPGPRCPLNEKNFAIHHPVVGPASDDAIIRSSIASIR